MQANRPLIISSQNSSSKQIRNVTYYLDGQPIGTSSIPPYRLSILPRTFGPAQLKAVAQLANGGSIQQTITFTLQ